MIYGEQTHAEFVAVRMSLDARYDKVCSVCHAAIGAPCRVPVKDGSKFINEVHRERLDEPVESA